VKVARIAPPAGGVAPAPRAAGAPEAPSGEPAAGPHARKLVEVHSGDTLSNLATRAYGRANYTTLDMLRARNPGIGDIDRILKGVSIEFPDPGPASRILQGDDGIAVLVLTTPQLVEALAIQESLGKRYDLPIELRPMELGKRRDLYRVSIRPRGGPQEALEIARNLGSILEDPGT
jgi:phage tail protein X